MRCGVFSLSEPDQFSIKLNDYYYDLFDGYEHHNWYHNVNMAFDDKEIHSIVIHLAFVEYNNELCSFGSCAGLHADDCI